MIPVSETAMLLHITTIMASVSEQQLRTGRPIYYMTGFFEEDSYFMELAKRYALYVRDSGVRPLNETLMLVNHPSLFLPPPGMNPDHGFVMMPFLDDKFSVAKLNAVW